MEFKLLCGIFENIRKSKGFRDKTEVSKEFFSKCRSEFETENIFCIMRLILPKLDRERDSYHMKESKIARVLIKMLALPSGKDKDVLSKSYLMSGHASDFGDVVYSVIKKYLSNGKTTLMISELNRSLDDMSKRSNEAEAEDILMKLFKKCSAEDARWIIRIILKELKLGIDANKILNSYHQDAANFYASNNNLRKVCEKLFDTNVNLHELDIEIFEPFRPMLSKRVDAAVFKKCLVDNKIFYIENKFDGERFQLHMENEKFKYFSRNGFDYTQTYGSSFTEGILTPELQDVFQPFAKKIILDGEMMLWNRYTKKFGCKGLEIDVKKLRKTGRYQPCFCVYDIILLNDKILTNRPFRERVNLLKRVFIQEITGTIVLSKITEIDSRQMIVDELNLAVEKEEEGLILKDPDSVYKYSDRNSGWYKMKLEYFQDTMNDLDLIVMGGQFASSTSDELNSFIVGVRSGQTENGKPIYLSFSKVSSGLSDVELDMLNQKLKTDGHVFDENHSKNLVFGKEVPHYFIEPENSVIFVVRATELVRTNSLSYKTSYTLRFPRVLKVRTDKPVDECLNMNELLELTNTNKHVIKLNKRNIELDEILQIKTRKVKKRIIEVIKFDDTSKISDLLEGYKIRVFNGSNENRSDSIEALVARAGGTLSYKTDNDVDIVLVGKYDVKAQKLCTKRWHFDVVDAKWLYRITKDGNLLPYETEEIYCLGNNIKNCLNDEVDRYGDSYTKKANIETLKHCFGLIKNLNEQPCFTPMIRRIGKCFKEYNAYFDQYENIDDYNSLVIYKCLEDVLEFRYYHGRVSDRIEDNTNLIVVANDVRKTVIQDYLDSIGREIEIFDRSFIYQHK